MAQTHEVIERLRKLWPDLEITIEQIRTRGDHIADMPLTQMGGDGVFVTEIERALRVGRIDLAVHSLKDLPTAQPDDLRIVVVGPRENVRDVIVWNDLVCPSIQPDGTPCGNPVWGTGNQETSNPGQALPLRIGTCSQRRSAQILALWPNALILPLRGNVDTRLRKLDSGDYDGIVLAAAGLHRLDMQDRLAGRTTYLSIEVMMPAPGQGALALEIRDQPEMHALVAPLNDLATHAATSAERTFMRRLGGGCYLPVAAYGEIVDEILILQGVVISLDGQRQVRVHQSIRWTRDAGVELAEQLGMHMAEQALAQGADEIIRAIEANKAQESQHARRGASWAGLGRMPVPRTGYPGGSPHSGIATLPLQGKRILVTRTREQANALSERLRALGAIPIEFPTIHIAPPQDWTPLDSALRRLCTAQPEPYYTRLVFTSVNGVNICFERLLRLGYDVTAIGNIRVAAIGPATAAALALYGVTADLVPGEYTAEGVSTALIEDARRRGESLSGKRILLARAAEARNVLVTTLQQAGAEMDEVAAYRTVTVASDDEQGRAVLQLLEAHQLDILTFTSSSTVRNFMQWLIDCEQNAKGSFTSLVTHNAQLKIACIGPITSQTARELGLNVHIEASEFTIDGLVEAIVQHEEVA